VIADRHKSGRIDDNDGWAWKYRNAWSPVNTATEYSARSPMSASTGRWVGAEPWANYRTVWSPAPEADIANARRLLWRTPVRVLQWTTLWETIVTGWVGR